MWSSQSWFAQQSSLRTKRELLSLKCGLKELGTVQDWHGLWLGQMTDHTKRAQSTLGRYFAEARQMLRQSLVGQRCSPPGCSRRMSHHK